MRLRPRAPNQSAPMCTETLVVGTPVARFRPSGRPYAPLRKAQADAARQPQACQPRFHSTRLHCSRASRSCPAQNLLGPEHRQLPPCHRSIFCNARTSRPDRPMSWRSFAAAPPSAGGVTQDDTFCAAPITPERSPSRRVGPADFLNLAGDFSPAPQERCNYKRLLHAAAVCRLPFAVCCLPLAAAVCRLPPLPYNPACPFTSTAVSARV